MPERAGSGEPVPRSFDGWSVLAILAEQRWIVLGVAAAIVMVGALFRLVMGSPVYTTEVAFYPQTQKASAGIAGLAAQFGVSVNTGGNGENPQFYSSLIQSRTIVTGLVDSTYDLLGDSASARADLVEYFGNVKKNGRAEAREAAIQYVQRNVVKVNVDRVAGVVTVDVTAFSPALTQAIAARLIDLVETFNVRALQSQASAERTFVEDRLRVTRAELADAEGSLKSFLEQNRQFQNSPELQLRFDQLQRGVDLRQQVVKLLAQSLEQARIDEVRGTPLITVLQRAEPGVPVRGTFPVSFVLVVVALLLGASAALFREGMRQLRTLDHPGFLRVREAFAGRGLGGGARPPPSSRRPRPAFDPPGSRPGARRVMRWRKQSLLGAGAISFAAAIWGACLTLVATPILYRGLGPFAYGVYALAFAVAGWGSYLDLGLGWTASKFVAEAEAERNPALVSATVRAVLIYTLLVGAVFTLGIVGLSGWITDALLRVRGPQAPEMRDVLRIAALTLFLSGLGGVLGSALRGAGRFSIATLISSGGVTLSVGASAWAAARGWGVATAARGQLFGSGTALLCSLVVCLPMLGHPVEPGAVLRRIRGMIGFSVWNFLNRVAQMFVFEFDKVLVARWAGAAFIPFYTVPFTLGQRVNFFGGPAVNAIYPAAAAGQYDRQAFLKKYFAASRLMHMLTGAVASVVFFAGGSFLSVWIAPEMGERGTYFLRLFAVGNWLLAVGSLDGACVEGWNRPRWTANVVFASLGLGAATVALGRLWLEPARAVALGVAVWLVCAGLGQAACWYALARYDLGSRVRRILLPLVEMVALAAVFSITVVPRLHSRLGMIAGLGVFTAALAGYGVLRAFERSERRALVARVLSWMPVANSTVDPLLEREATEPVGLEP